MKSVMGEEDKKRSMAHYVQAQHIRTRERLANRKVFPVPKVGDIIIYNEQQRFHEKHEAAPKRGVGEVTGICGHIVVLRKMYKGGQFFTRSLRVDDFENGLYTFIVLERMPEECPAPAEMDIEKLCKELAELVKFKKPQGF